MRVNDARQTFQFRLIVGCFITLQQTIHSIYDSRIIRGRRELLPDRQGLLDNASHIYLSMRIVIGFNIVTIGSGKGLFIFAFSHCIQTYYPVRGSCGVGHTKTQKSDFQQYHPNGTELTNTKQNKSSWVSFDSKTQQTMNPQGKSAV